LDRLLSAIPNSHLMFDSPIPEVSGEGFNLSKKTNSSGPNTSTPADDLDNDDEVANTSRLKGGKEAPRSRGSSPCLAVYREENPNNPFNREEDRKILNVHHDQVLVSLLDVELAPASFRISRSVMMKTCMTLI